jgi:putative ABC transport system permease protein
VSPTLLRAASRHLARHPGQAGLALAGVALGVAVVASIDLANASARRALELATETVTGRATHEVVGGSAGVDERLYARLRLGGVDPAAPIVEAIATTRRAPGRAFQLLGVDPLAEAPFRPYTAGGAGPGLRGLRVLLTQPGTVLLLRETAVELGLESGAALDLRIGGVHRTARVAGWLEAGDGISRRALEGLIVTDIATAQELVGSVGRLSRIDLRVADGAEGASLLRRVATLLPPGVELVPASVRGEFVAQLTRAFSVNLEALSLLALFVGLFLVYNATSFSVVQRRATIGMLRAVGVTRRELFAVLMLEGLGLGVVASGLGLLLGLALARGLVGLVARTINDLYFVLAVRDLAVAPGVLVKGALLGVGGTLAATALPALEATTAPPGSVVSRAVVESRARMQAPWAALIGLLCLAGGASALGLSGRSLGWSYAGLFALLVGCALLTPLAVIAFVRLALPAAGGFGLLGRLAIREVEASLSRTAVALAALVIAVAATIGVGLMIGSFRQAVVDWLATALAADVYVSAPGPVGSRTGASLDPAVIARLAGAPGIGAVGTYRRVTVGSAFGPTQLVALRPATPSRHQFRFVAGAPEAAWSAFQDGESVIVSEPYAYRHHLAVESSLSLRTDRGERPFRVAGVFTDYGSDQGVVMMSRATYERYWSDRGISSLGLLAAPGVDVDELVLRLRRLAGPEQELLIRSNRALRDASLEVFDRTFVITGVLRLLATVVAVVGVLAALMALQLERGREVAVLRVQGLTPRQVWGLATAQTGLMGLLAGLLAVPVGIGVADVLVFVINRRSFGWTLPVVIAPRVLVEAVALAVTTAVLAGLYPAFRMARATPAAALRDE